MGRVGKPRRHLGPISTQELTGVLPFGQSHRLIRLIIIGLQGRRGALTFMMRAMDLVELDLGTYLEQAGTVFESLPTPR